MSGELKAPVEWLYPRTTPSSIQGRGLAEDNFAQEERGVSAMLIREALQNTLDAMDPSTNGPVKLSIRFLKPEQVNSTFLRAIFNEDYTDRLAASAPKLPSLDLTDTTALVIEDFGTVGLQGTYTNANKDGDAENWNAFWFREGEGAKAGPGSNGRAGQGKVTYFNASKARALLALTIRRDDHKPLLMGRASFPRDYPMGPHKYARDSFLCRPLSKIDDPVLPFEQPELISAFVSSFQLERQSEPGLSLVIPFASFNEEEALRTVISDFYYPITCRRLEVKINEIVITSATVDQQAENLGRLAPLSLSKGFRKFIRGVLGERKHCVELKQGWEKDTVLKEAAFPDHSVDKLRAALENGERITVTCPITVKPRSPGVRQATKFEVHIQIGEELEKSEEAYIRRDLLIGGEKHISGKLHLQKARALTIVEEAALSAVMADAEEATHLRWNASRPRLTEDYLNPDRVVKAVRLAAPRLLEFLTKGLSSRDVKALARYFTKPDPHSAKSTPGSEPSGQLGGGVDKPQPPPPKPKPLRLQAGDDWVRVRPNPHPEAPQLNLPVECVLEGAYLGLDTDPFESYDPFDFELSDERLYPVVSSGCTIRSKLYNRIEFSIDEPAFDLHVSGFDRNIMLKTRLTYKETVSEPVIDEE